MSPLSLRVLYALDRNLTGADEAPPSEGWRGADQTRVMSFVGAITNVVVGYVLAIGTQWVAFPLFGLNVSLGDSVLISLVFTAVSLGRGYLLRRFFERLRVIRHRDR